MADELNALIAELNRIKDFPARAAPEVAQSCAAIVRGNIAAQRAPDGAPWPDTADGRLALQGTEVRTAVMGTAVVLSIDGPAVLHHEGRARGKVKRQILPSRKIPQPMVQAIRGALARAFNRG
jgi:hypothetical protein